MLHEILPSLLAINFLFVGWANSENLDAECRANDVFQVFDLDTFILGLRYIPHRFVTKQHRSPVEKLNNFLVGGTKSSDPKENLDLVLEQLMLDQKNKISSQDRYNQFKRLFAALSTLLGENKCNYYSYVVLHKNMEAIRTSVGSIIADKNLRRIDKVLAHYILEHVRDCGSVYFKRFDEIMESFDPEAYQRLDAITKGAVENAGSDMRPVNVGKSHAERFYNAATHKNRGVYDLEPKRIYDALKESSANDPDAKCLVPIEDDRDGVSKIKVDKFDRIYEQYITEPCKQFRKQFGPKVFRIFEFDVQFGGQVDETRPDFYKAWYKYRLCMEFHVTRQVSVLKYANFQLELSNKM